MHQEILQQISEKTDIRGIVQVGANTGQESGLFRQYTNNFICFEPIPGPFQILRSNNPDITCYNFALGDTNETKTMHIASNNGESSSFLEPKTHLQEFQWIQFNQKADFEIKRFDSLGIKLDPFNILFSDTQGYELNVLKGFGEMIRSFDFIMTEYINTEFYEGDSKESDITNYLKEFEFSLFQIYPESGGNWGNVLYINNKIK